MLSLIQQIVRSVQCVEASGRMEILTKQFLQQSEDGKVKHTTTCRILAQIMETEKSAQNTTNDLPISASMTRTISRNRNQLHPMAAKPAQIYKVNPTPMTAKLPVISSPRS